MSKRKKSLNPTNISPYSSPRIDVSLELDVQALRKKNGQLVQAVAKLQNEKAQQQNQIISLQEEYYKLNSKFLNLRNIFLNVDAATKVGLPKFVELSEMLTNVMQLCTVGLAVTSFNKDTKTQTVKPHIVNGHVLHNPTITLSRLSETIQPNTPPRRSSNQSSPVRMTSPVRINVSCQEMNRPSGSRSRDSAGDRHSNRETEDAEGYDELSRPYYRRAGVVRSLAPLNMNDFNREDDDMTEENEDEINQDTYCSRLITIQEEDDEDDEYPISRNASSRRFSERVREVRIYIDRLPSEYVNREFNRDSGNSALRRSGDLSNNNTIMSPTRTKIRQEVYSSAEQVSFTMSPTKRMSQSLSMREKSPSKMSGAKEKEQSKFAINSVYSEISTIQNLPSSSMSMLDDSCNFNNSKTFMMKSLGLEPKNEHLTTSTPLRERPRRLTRKPKKLSSSVSSSSSSSSGSDGSLPYFSQRRSDRSPFRNVVKTRGKSDDKKKIAQVVINRLSLEKRLSGSPIKKVGEILNSRVITRVSDMKRESAGKTANRKSASSDDIDSDDSGDKTFKVYLKAEKNKEKKNKRAQAAVDRLSLSSSPIVKKEKDFKNRVVTKVSDSKNKFEKRRKLVSVRSEDIDNDDSNDEAFKLCQKVEKRSASNTGGSAKSQIITKKIAKPISTNMPRSPRLARSAKPRVLQEPSLRKKMRRSR